MKINNSMDDNWLKISRSQERDAYYQAGHAVIALIESLDVVRLFMEDDGSSWIDVRYPDLDQSRLSRSVRARSDAKSVIRALLAGPAAQMRYSFGTCNTGHALPDFDLGASYMVESEAVWRAISLAGGSGRGHGGGRSHGGGDGGINRETVRRYQGRQAQITGKIGPKLTTPVMLTALN
jgi:hypothetical protein